MQLHKNQLEADKKWRDKNKEKANYLKQRSSARSFIRNKAILEDLEELKKLIAERQEELGGSENEF